MLKAQLPVLPAEKEKEQQVRSVAVHNIRITVRCASSFTETLNFLIVGTFLTTDYMSNKENSEQESHVESTTTNTTGRKRSAGNMAVHDVRTAVRFVSSYSGINYFKP